MRSHCSLLLAAFLLSACGDGASSATPASDTGAMHDTLADATTSDTDGEDTSSADAGDETDMAEDSATDAVEDTAVEDVADEDVTDAADDTGDDAVAADTGADTDADPSSNDCLPDPFDIGATYTNVIYVSPDGREDGDGSRTTPFATLPQAAAVAAPGTDIVLLEGRYLVGSTWFVEGLVGTEAQPVRIRGEGDAVLDGTGSQETLHLIEPSYVVLEDFAVTGAEVNGLNVDDGGTFDTPAHHVVMRRLELYDVGSGGNNDCIKISGLDDFFIVDSRFRNCNAGNTIDMVGCHDGVIARNVTSGSPKGIQAKGGTSDILISGNTFIDIPGRGVNAGGSTGLEFFRPLDAPHEAARIVMTGNIFDTVGADSGAPVAFVGCDACVFAHNTLISPQTWVARILQENVDAERFVPSRDGIFANNLIVLDLDDMRSGAYVNVGGNTAPETFYFDNNLWWDADVPDFAGPNYPGGIPAATNSITGMDPALDESGLPTTTEGILGAGDAALDGAPYPDFNGACFSDTPSVGAFELADD